MDGREGMTLQGSTSYYLNRSGLGGFGSTGSGHNVHHGSGMPGGPPIFKTPSNSNILVQLSVQSGLSFHVENLTPNFPHKMGIADIVSGGGNGGNHLVKNKRGRPRKYAVMELTCPWGSLPCLLSILLPFPPSSSALEKRR